MSSGRVCPACGRRIAENEAYHVCSVCHRNYHLGCRCPVHPNARMITRESGIVIEVSRGRGSIQIPRWTRAVGLVLLIMLVICLLVGRGMIFPSTNASPPHLSSMSVDISPTSVPHEQSLASAPSIPTPLYIAYVHGDVGNTDVYVSPLQGADRTCVACSSCDEAEPAWSPDGQYVIFQSDCGGSYDIWFVGREGGRPTQLTYTPDVDEREPDWSPNGSEIVYRTSPLGSPRNADGEIWVMNADGSGSHGLGVRGRSPVWSPEGHRIAFMSERRGGWEIYVYDLRDRSMIRLTSCSANCRWPSWSPDGQYVIYNSTTGPGSTIADTIWYISATGGTPRRLVSSQHTGRPSWSVYGLIAFNSDRGIETVSTDGSGRQILISGDQNWAPAWSK